MRALISMLYNLCAQISFVTQASPGVVETPSVGSTPSTPPHWIDGVYEVDFIFVAIAVGVLIIVGITYLLRHLLPSPRPTPKH